MNGEDTDSDSSDSSNEFMATAEQIKSISPFFTKSSPRNPSATSSRFIESSDESSDFNYDDESHENTADLMTQVMKNLEAANKKVGCATSLNEIAHIDNKVSSKAKNVGIHPPKGELTNEIADLLRLGETGAVASTSNQDHDEPEDETAEVSAPPDYSVPKDGVKITLVDPTLIFNQRRKKKHESIEDVLKRRLNQQLKSNQILLHKVGLLCWLAHGFYLNKQINNPILLSAALNLTPKNCYPKGRVDLEYLEKITKWFKGIFSNLVGKPEESVTTLVLLKRIKEKKIQGYHELVLLYIATLRALGLTCRLVVSLQPPLAKVNREQLIAPETEKKSGKTKMQPGKGQGTKSLKSGKPKLKEEKSPVKQEPEKTNISARLRKATDARQRAAEILKRKTDESTSDASPETTKPPAKKLAMKSKAAAAERSTVKSTKEGAANSNTKTEADAKPVRNLRSRTNTAEKHWPTKGNEDEDEDEDKEDDEQEEEEEPVKKTSKQISHTRGKASGSKSKAATKQSKAKARRSSEARRLLSSDEEDESDDDKPRRPKQTRDIWAEVYVESEENWISVSVSDGKIHCTAELYKNATVPVLYVMAWNSEGYIKDVTRRYCPHWLTITRKQRIDEKWWLPAHTPWREPETARTKAEDEMLKQKELEQPLPKTVSECKGHPLYVLPRHLLKFEALYPADVVPLGYVRNEPIYSRHCVHTLYSRETWVKNARVVKPGEICYKVVKARPKYDKLSGIRLQDETLEIFGKWQTEQYVPPEAKNGVVPRNEYGNVDLFKDCMLPKGTVHIRLPALNRVARKLDIDCAPAVTGFHFGGYRAVPAFDGFIVCEEFEDVLREAWEVEQVAADKRAREKYEQRVYGNWRKLIKAVLIRERLTAKYDFAAKEEKSNMSKKQPNKRIKQTKGGGKKAKVDDKK